jgi:hypothetical protein
MHPSNSLGPQVLTGLDERGLVRPRRESLGVPPLSSASRASSRVFSLFACFTDARRMTMSPRVAGRTMTTNLNPWLGAAPATSSTG